MDVVNKNPRRYVMLSPQVARSGGGENQHPALYALSWFPCAQFIQPQESCHSLRTRQRGHQLESSDLSKWILVTRTRKGRRVRAVCKNNCICCEIRQAGSSRNCQIALPSGRSAYPLGHFTNFGACCPCEARGGNTAAASDATIICFLSERL